MLYSRQSVMQEQRISITRNLLQSFSVLTMGAEELSSYVREAVTDNPLISFESLPGSRPDDCLPDAQILSDKYCIVDRQSNALETLSDGKADLRRYLSLQLPGSAFGTQREKLLLHLINCIDDDGYFRESTSAVAKRLGCGEEEVKRCLSIIKEMDPPGVGAANLSECLVIQLERGYPGERIAYMIADKYLELLAQNKVKALANELECSITSVNAAAELIRSLDPRPGAAYHDATPQYIIPDVVVRCVDEGFEVSLSREVQYDLRVDSSYISYFRGCEDEDVRSYVKEKYQQVQAIRRFIDKRNSTLLLVAKEIFEQQKAFFYRGQEYLRPLKRRQIADRLGCHESTVSRAVKNKYISCMWGDYPFSYFFSNALECEEGYYTCNARAMIRRLIDDENKAEPLSDSALAALLDGEGVEVSRRTVAKYREQMGIPNATLRRRYETD